MLAANLETGRGLPFASVVSQATPNFPRPADFSEFRNAAFGHPVRLFGFSISCGMKLTDFRRTVKEHQPTPKNLLENPWAEDRKGQVISTPRSHPVPKKMKPLHVPSSSRGSKSKPATGKAKLSILLCPVIVKAARKHAAQKGESLSAFVTRAIQRQLLTSETGQPKECVKVPYESVAPIILTDPTGEWKKAAKKNGMSVAEWLGALGNEMAFKINYVEQIERIRDIRAYDKAIAGERMSFDEFEQSQRHRDRLAAQGAKPKAPKP